MLKLTVYNPDTTIYCVQFFNDRPSAELWISDEQTRPYWNVGSTFSIIDVTEVPSSDQVLVRQMNELRLQRNALLVSSDWTQLPDAPIDNSRKILWIAYRQSLRDLPQQPNLDPANPTWPTKPS
jgi:hypothetical protein